MNKDLQTESFLQDLPYEGKGMIVGLDKLISRLQNAANVVVTGSTDAAGSKATVTISGKALEKLKALDELEKIKAELNKSNVDLTIDYKDNGDITGEVIVLKESVELEDTEEESKTTLDYLQDRIGQSMSVSELNTVLQSIFGKFNEVFLLASDFNENDLNETHELVVFDDEDNMYTITCKLTDLLDPTVEIVDVAVE